MGNISDLLDVLSKLSRIPKDKVLYTMHEFSFNNLMLEDFTDQAACSQNMAAPSLIISFACGKAKLTLYTLGSHSA